MNTIDDDFILFQNLTLNEIVKLYLNIQGVKKADEGNYDEAMEYFSNAIEMSPEDSVSYFNRASLKMYLGDIYGAELDIKALGTSGLTKLLQWGYSFALIFLILILFL